MLEVFATLRASAARVLREVRVDGLSVAAAARMLDDVLAVEKAMAGVKLLVADRAAEGQGPRGAAEDLARRSGVSLGQARGLLDAARQVKEQPQVEEVLRQGSLSEQQATVIADAAAVNPGAAGLLLEKARTESLRGLRDACGQAKAAADADEEATHARIHAGRCFRTGRDPDGAFTGSMRGTVGDGAAFMARFQPFRDAVFAANRQAGRRDSSDAMDFDALMAMAAAAHPNTTTTSGAPVVPVKPPAQVHVVVNWDSLIAGHQPGAEPAYIAGFGPVPVSVVRAVMDDAFLVGVVMQGTEVVKIKRFGRHVPLELRDALRVRDRFQCTTPGCTNWRRLEMDHIQPHARGGEISYTNLEDLCDTCHPEKTRNDRLFDDTG